MTSATPQTPLNRHPEVRRLLPWLLVPPAALAAFDARLGSLVVALAAVAFFLGAAHRTSRKHQNQTESDTSKLLLKGATPIGLVALVTWQTYCWLRPHGGPLPLVAVDQVLSLVVLILASGAGAWVGLQAADSAKDRRQVLAMTVSASLAALALWLVLWTVLWEAVTQGVFIHIEHLRGIPTYWYQMLPGPLSFCSLALSLALVAWWFPRPLAAQPRGVSRYLRGAAGSMWEPGRIMLVSPLAACLSIYWRQFHYHDPALIDAPFFVTLGGLALLCGGLGWLVVWKPVSRAWTTARNPLARGVVLGLVLGIVGLALFHMALATLGFAQARSIWPAALTSGLAVGLLAGISASSRPQTT